MVRAFQHDTGLSAISSRVHLTAGNQALLGREPVIFEEQKRSPIFFNQERVRIKAIPSWLDASGNFCTTEVTSPWGRLQSKAPLLSK